MNTEELFFLKSEINQIPKAVVNSFLSKDSTLKLLLKYIKKNKNRIKYFSLNSSSGISITTKHVFEIGDELAVSFNLIYNNKNSVISLKGLTNNSTINLSGTKSKILISQIIKYYKQEKKEIIKYYSVECINFKIKKILKNKHYNYQNHYKNFESVSRTDRVNFIRHLEYNISQDHKNLKEIYQIYNKISKSLNPLLNDSILNNIVRLNDYIINQIEFYNFLDDHFL